MRITLLILLGISFILTVHRGWAEESKLDNQLNGELKSRAYLDTRQDDQYEDKEAFDTRLLFKDTLTVKDWGATFFISTEARFDYLVRDRSEKDADFFLKEAYVRFDRPRSAVTVGKQAVTWGKLDNVLLLDQINPQDYSTFILYDKQERKIPAYMVKYDYYGQSFRVEGVYLPLFRPSQGNFFGTDWAVFGHVKQAIEEGSYSQAVKDVVSKIGTTHDDEAEDGAFKNSQAGIRVQTTVRDIDVSWYYMYLYDRIAVLQERDPAGLAVKKFLYLPTEVNLAALAAADPSHAQAILKESHQRVHVIGKDFETVIGAYGLRGECGVFLDLPYLRDDFSYTRKKTVMAGFGLDHTTAAEWYWNLQWIQTIVLDYEPLFAQEEYTHLMTGTIRKDFLRGDLKLDVDASFNLSCHDWMLNPELIYRFRSGTHFTLGGFIFEGAPTTTFGRYSAKDLIYLQVKQSF